MSKQIYGKVYLRMEIQTTTSNLKNYLRAIYCNGKNKQKEPKIKQESFAWPTECISGL